MTITSHTITRDIPDIGLTDITFNYTPGKPGRRWGADLEVLRAATLQDSAPLTARELRDIAQEHLDDGGYDFACAVAREQRGEPQ